MSAWVGRGCRFTNCIHNTGEDEALQPSKRKRCRKRRPKVVSTEEKAILYCMDEKDWREFNREETRA